MELFKKRNKRHAIKNGAFRLKASVTLEAALALPFFLFFMVNLLTLFDVLRVQCALEAALHQTGREIGVHAFEVAYADDLVREAMGKGGDGLTGSAAGSVLSTAYAAGRTKDYLNFMSPNMNCVVGGQGGISYLRSGFLQGGDVIDLVVSYRVQPLVNVMGFATFPMEARYYAHAWTGYRIPGTTDETGEEEETVYITQTGTVYHRSASCTYLKPSVRSVSRADLGALRNDSGGKYYPCEACGGGTAGTAYITTYGDRYHASASCNKLARTIYTVPISEVGGRAPCSKCGGSH